MSSVLLFSYALALMLLAAALWAYSRGNRQALEEKVSRRLGEWADVKPAERYRPRRSAPNGADRLLRQAGIEPQGWHLPMGLLCVAGIAFWGASEGLVVGLTAPLAAVAFVYFWLMHRSQKRRALLLNQLPLFLDQVLRGLGTGRSMDGSLSLAAAETPQPLKEVVDRVLRATDLGADLGYALQDAANTYRLQELYLVAMAVRINRVYGSSVRELLQNVIRMIHQREAARRELRALTGETRLSAWVLGLLPPGMAFYIMAMNPGYLQSMWNDPSGQVTLTVAVVLQAAGAIALWRMVKSI